MITQHYCLIQTNHQGQKKLDEKKKFFSVTQIFKNSLENPENINLRYKKNDC